MPYHDPDASDPLTLHGVVVETGGEESMREMAECFVEEYLRSGFDADQLLRMFKTRGYAGPFLAYQTLGEDAIQRIIDERASLRGDGCRKPRAAPDHEGWVSLPVLER